MANQPTSYTGQYLQRVLNPDTPPSAPLQQRPHPILSQRCPQAGPRDCMTRIQGHANHGNCNSSIRRPRSGGDRRRNRHRRCHRRTTRIRRPPPSSSPTSTPRAPRSAPPGFQDAGGIAAACTTNVGEIDQVQAMIQAAVRPLGPPRHHRQQRLPRPGSMTGGAEDVPARRLRPRHGRPRQGQLPVGKVRRAPPAPSWWRQHRQHLKHSRPACCSWRPRLRTGKAALIAATRQMAVEYGRDGIRVNAIAPGHIVTEGIQAGLWDQNPPGLSSLRPSTPSAAADAPPTSPPPSPFSVQKMRRLSPATPSSSDGGHSLQIQRNFGVAQAQYIKDHPHTQLPTSRSQPARQSSPSPSIPSFFPSPRGEADSGVRAGNR